MCLLLIGVFLIVKGEHVNRINDVVGIEHSQIYLLNTFSVLMIITALLQFSVSLLGSYATTKEISRAHQLVRIDCNLSLLYFFQTFFKNTVFLAFLSIMYVPHNVEKV